MRLTCPPEILLACLPQVRVWTSADVCDLSDERGGYVLIMHLHTQLRVSWARAKKAALDPGWYVYAGNANGPGGLRARLARHLRKDKKSHWHVDQVTICAQTWALALPDDDECALVATLLEGGNFNAPLVGFGSSDCKTCTSHFLRFAADEPASQT